MRASGFILNDPIQNYKSSFAAPCGRGGLAIPGKLQRLILAALLAACSTALAQAPKAPAADASPRFEIRRFVFDGASLVPAEQLAEATAEFTGAGRTFADVQRALEAVERAYSEAGYSAVQVVLPEQELERGEVRFQIVEAKVGRVIVEGNKNFTDENVRASIPALVPGRAPNINEIARNLRVANESPSKQETVLLRSGQEEATVDAVVRVVDEKPVKFSASLDNTGNAQTGRLRVGLGFQHGNSGGGDEVITMQYVYAPYTDELNAAGEPDDLTIIPNRRVTILGFGYRIPLYALGDVLDFTAGYSNVDSGTVGGIFNVTGAGTIFGARYTRNLNRIGDYDHRWQFSLDYRSYDNKDVTAVGDPTNTQLIPDVTVHPVTAMYSGVVRQQDGEAGFQIGLSKNIPGGNDGDDATFCASRSDGVGQCAGAQYTIWRWGFNYNRALAGDWQARLTMNGQVTDDMLVTGEQFGIGGMDSVRGFSEREVTGDSGFRGSAEVYTPDFGGVSGVSGMRTRALAFIDWGGTYRVNPAPGEIQRQHISSAGLGIRIGHSTNFSLRADWAMVWNEGGNQGSGDSRVHFSLSYVF
ncbi:MAG TPA: ShlB/FhaC/HecB family hemolysin secretion/activation protein [Burkholderiales bacterium]